MDNRRGTKNNGSRHQQQIHKLKGRMDRVTKLSSNNATRSQNSGFLQQFFENVVVALKRKNRNAQNKWRRRKPLFSHPFEFDKSTRAVHRSVNVVQSFFLRNLML
jgi:hypothetical protein